MQWLPLLSWGGVIYYFSSLSQEEVQLYFLPFPYEEGKILRMDKILHALEYGILGILCYRAFLSTLGSQEARSALFLAIIASICYGLSDEVHQAFVPTRQADGWDLLADGVGACFAVLVWRYLIEPSPRPKPITRQSKWNPSV